METPLRKNELKVIALLSGMLREFRLINSNTSLDDMHNLICKTTNEVLDVCEGKNTPTSEEQLATPDVSKLLCGSFKPDNKTSSATKCKCGYEKWEHPKAT